MNYAAPVLSYLELRGHIRTGDVIGIVSHGPFAFLVRLVQSFAGLGECAHITHCGVAKWIDDRLYLVEMDGAHNVLSPLSQYRDRDMYVFECPVSEQAIADQFNRAINTFIPYGYLDLVQIGLRLLFRIRSKGDERDLVCSQFVLAWLVWAGWTPPREMPGMPSPAELCKPLQLKFRTQAS